MIVLARLAATAAIAAVVLATAAKAETAVFAGGCFWCVESDLDKVPGVTSTVSGFTGGKSASPTYDNHDGHVEAVEVEFDPAVTSYEALAAHFLRTIDVTDGGGQFCDRGGSYVSALFPRGAAQKAAAKKVLAAAAAELGQPVATGIRPSGAFTAAGPEHQNYAKGVNRVFTRFGLIRQSDAYQRYRKACGRDARVREVWGKSAYGFPAGS